MKNAQQLYREYLHADIAYNAAVTLQLNDPAPVRRDVMLKAEMARNIAYDRYRSAAMHAAYKAACANA